MNGFSIYLFKSCRTRQDDCKTSPLADRRSHFDAAATLVDDALTDCKPQTIAAAGSLGGKKWFKYLFCNIRIDSAAIITDGNADRLALLS